MAAEYDDSVVLEVECLCERSSKHKNRAKMVEILRNIGNVSYAAETVDGILTTLFESNEMFFESSRDALNHSIKVAIVNGDLAKLRTIITHDAAYRSQILYAAMWHAINCDSAPAMEVIAGAAIQHNVVLRVDKIMAVIFVSGSLNLYEPIVSYCERTNHWLSMSPRSRLAFACVMGSELFMEHIITLHHLGCADAEAALRDVKYMMSPSYFMGYPVSVAGERGELIVKTRAPAGIQWLRDQFSIGAANIADQFSIGAANIADQFSIGAASIGSANTTATGTVEV